MAEHDPVATITRSKLEERFLALCEGAGIPRPRVNERLIIDEETVEVDFLWPDARLIVEVDGHRFHATRQAFERDRMRDHRLLVAGWRVVRCTWRQLAQHPAEIAHAIRALLASR